MRVTLLGTGTPAPNPKRFQSSVLVEIGDDRLLFDAGRGAVHQMGVLGVDIGRINPVFITHHHVDHINDLFDVMITSAFCGRKVPLEIYGPNGTNEIVRALVENVYARDIRSRRTPDQACEGMSGIDAIGCRTVHDIGAGVVCERPGWRVIADVVRHGDFSHDPDFDWCCLGYRIEAGGRVVTISGDTVPCEGIQRLARDADLLVQCCHFSEARLTDASVQEMTRHTLPSSAQVGAIAAEADVKHVVLTHISADGAEASLEDEVRRHGAARVTLGADGMTFEVE